MLLQDFEDSISSADLGRALLARAGVSSADSEALLGSGFFAVDKDILPTELELLLMNAEPVDLVHPSFQLQDYSRYSQPKGVKVVIVDRFTGAIFRPARLTEAAVFGRFGDSLDLSYLGQQVTEIGRSRFHQFPYFDVEEPNTLARLCETLKHHEEQAGFKILFRGQTREYLLGRRPEVTSFLYGKSDVREPSLPSNAFRNKFNYSIAEPYVRLILREILYRRTKRHDKKHWVEDRFEELNILGLGNELSAAIQDVMGIGQHYGIPTYGIDATSSWETAFWFATHKFGNDNGKSFFAAYQWVNRESHKWPIIYVLRTKSFTDLHLMSYPSIRAKAQNAFFLGGSWGLHGNAAANDIICALRLNPAVGFDTHDVAEIFPMPSSDAMYRELLEAKRRYRSDPLFTKIGLDQVFELNY